MHKQQTNQPQDTPITPAKILEELLEVSEQEFNDSPSTRHIQFEQSLQQIQEQEFADRLQEKKAQIQKNRQSLQSIQMQILSVNKFHEQFIQLHDDRRILEKDILDLEFEVIRLERQIEIKRRHRNAVNIVEEEENDFQEQLQEKKENNTIRQAPEEQEESLKISEIRRLENSLASRQETPMIDSYMMSSIKKVNNSEKPAEGNKKEIEPQKIDSNQKKTKEISSYRDTNLLRSWSSTLSLNRFVREKRTDYLSANQLYRHQIQRSMLQNRLAMDYINTKYLS